MANIVKKSKFEGKRHYKVWDGMSTEKFGVNPYSTEIYNLLYKKEPIEEAHTDTEVNIRMAKKFVDVRSRVGMYVTAREYLYGLSRHGIDLLFYLSYNIEENLNLVYLNKQKCYNFMKLRDFAIKLVEKDKNRGKEILDEEAAISAKENRLFRAALNSLIDCEAITPSKLKNYYWFSPRIFMKGSVEKIPMGHNGYNEKELVKVDKNNYTYKGYNIFDFKGFEILQLNIKLDSLEACVNHIDKI